MHSYSAQLRKDISDYLARCGTEDPGSVLDFLWRTYSASNPVDDGAIRKCDLQLAPVFEELSVPASDALFDLITDTCAAYQRAAFLEGIRIGFSLAQDLEHP